MSLSVQKSSKDRSIVPAYSIVSAYLAALLILIFSRTVPAVSCTSASRLHQNSVSSVHTIEMRSYARSVLIDTREEKASLEADLKAGTTALIRSGP